MHKEFNSSFRFRRTSFIVTLKQTPYASKQNQILCNFYKSKVEDISFFVLIPSYKSTQKETSAPVLFYYIDKTGGGRGRHAPCCNCRSDTLLVLKSILICTDYKLACISSRERYTLCRRNMPAASGENIIKRGNE